MPFYQNKALEQTLKTILRFESLLWGNNGWILKGKKATSKHSLNHLSYYYVIPLGAVENLKNPLYTTFISATKAWANQVIQ